MAVKPKPYIPSFMQAAVSGSRPIQLTFSQVSDTNIKSTSSFIYDSPGAPLQSTQQLNVDWSKFENHTFFMSAEAKVNLAFDQIINGYPFDGTRSEVEAFFERLTGFDKWVFDEFPKYKGWLHFSGTQVGEDTDGTLGTYIVVNDYAGGLYPEISKNKTGDTVINPKSGSSMTIEAHVLIPSLATSGPQILIQKTLYDQGFSLYLMPTGSTTLADLRFSVFSGSHNTSVSMELTKGAFNHVAAIFDKEMGVHRLHLYRNGELNNTSRTFVDINDLNIDGAYLTIATGSAFTLSSTSITPTQTFSGSIDELRIYHAVRSQEQIQRNMKKATFTTPDLKLYYKFNEPAGIADVTDTIDSIVIDSSGNSLHALITNFTESLRIDATDNELNPMVYEIDEVSPVLFPAYDAIITLNSDLLVTASLYDKENPNLITRLIPQHYLLEGAAFEGFKEIEGNSGNAYAGDGIPGQGKMGNTQLMLSLLYIYARFFDELKLFVDSFSTLRYVNYDTDDTIPDTFILDLIEEFGFHLPPFFNDSTIEQYLYAENINREFGISTYPLKYVQQQLLRRVLVNLPDVLRSKGTQHSIKSFLRAVGIDPDNSLRIREYGGPTERGLTFSRESKNEPGVMAYFTTSSMAVSPFLSASRVETGFPDPAGSMLFVGTTSPNGISNNVNDGLLTSGSWTVEQIVKFTPTHVRSMTSTTQSLVRLCTTGSVSGGIGIVANLLAISSSVDPKVKLYIRPGTSTASPLLTMIVPLQGAGIFDSDRWNVSFGCIRNDAVNSRVSSSYFLRVATQNNGQITTLLHTSSFFYELASNDNNALRTKNSGSNASGSFIAIGQQQFASGTGTGTGYLFLNDTAVVEDEGRNTQLVGLVSNLRFWSKALTLDEWQEHVRNYKSVGVKNPLLNYNFGKTSSGSFERLRLDAISKQDTRTASGTTGAITFLDFSLNGNHLTGTMFQTGSNTLVGEIFDHSYISPYFDEALTNEKVRVRSYIDNDLVNSAPWISQAPLHEIEKSERPTDDTRFAVEFSLVDALNRDMVTMFATLDAMDNALGNPELVFSSDYPDLDRMRDLYFNRIGEKLNFKAFFEFFRWFDTSIGTFIEQLIPRKTRFKGTNYIIESHMLERHKIEYMHHEMYIGESNRNRIRDVLLLQQIVGTLRKF